MVHGGEVIVNEDNYSDYERSLRRLDEPDDKLKRMTDRVRDIQAKTGVSTAEAYDAILRESSFDIDQIHGRVGGGLYSRIERDSPPPRPAPRITFMQMIKSRINSFLRPG
jgi:hypothetical protein